MCRNNNTVCFAKSRLVSAYAFRRDLRTCTLATRVNADQIPVPTAAGGLFVRVARFERIGLGATNFAQKIVANTASILDVITTFHVRRRIS